MTHAGKETALHGLSTLEEGIVDEDRKMSNAYLGRKGSFN